MFLRSVGIKRSLTTRLRRVVFTTGVLILTSLAANAQQPFYTDDADVTDRKKLHLQLSNEQDILQRASYPALRQNTSVFELDYGVLKNVEVGVDGPLIAISNSHLVTPTTPFGLGDLDFHVKYNFLKEREGSRLPALATTFNIELPTGNKREQLGSGLADYFLNGILQKSLTKKTKLRLNGGILFAGNDTTGDIGIKTRGRVFVGGGSLVKQFTPKLDLGVELTGAVGGNLQLQKGPIATSGWRQLSVQQKDVIRLWNSRWQVQQPTRRRATWSLD